MYLLPTALNNLRTFEVAARKLSFKDAAEELCLSASAVSRQIQSLEDDIGVTLFVRQNRSLQLTEEGRQLFITTAEALSQLSATVKAISPQTKQQLRLSAQPYFANNWLLPRLNEFTEQHGDIGLTFESDLTYQSFDSAKIDGCFRFAPTESEETVAMPLFRQYLVPVASPELLRQHGWNGDLSILSKLRWFHSSSQPQMWTSWQTHFQQEQLQPLESLHFDDAETALQAAREGLGVVMGAMPLIQRDIDRGTLIPLTEQQEALSAVYYFVYPKQHSNPAITAMVEWLDRYQVGI
jgi:LysR family transcriptional regulator, glycine cleavage system transcriptional activator